ncbi:MAG: hypothetical protein ACHQF2_12255 [Flavobacteriales bacterium]
MSQPSENTEQKTSLKQSVLPVTINDLREKDFSGNEISAEEREALENYDQYRIEYLNASNTEEEFHKRYFELQAKANLAPFTEFLKGKYSSKS